MSKSSFVFYAEWIPQIRLLEESGTEDDRKAFWDALESFVTDGCITTELTPLAKAVLAPMRNQIKRDAERYAATVQKRKEAANKRWSASASKAMQADASECKPMQMDANGCKAMQGNANDADNVDVDVDVYVDVDDNVSPNGDNNISSISLPVPQYEAPTNPAKMTDKVLEEEFDALWMLYPRKAGKADALRHYKAARKNGTAYEEVEQGILRYTRHIEDEHTDPQYIAMGSTWFNGHRWEDQYPRGEPKVGSLEWLASLQ